jgi:hypothetical protein
VRRHLHLMNRPPADFDLTGLQECWHFFYGHQCSDSLSIDEHNVSLCSSLVFAQCMQWHTRRHQTGRTDCDSSLSLTSYFHRTGPQHTPRHARSRLGRLRRPEQGGSDCSL